MSLPSTDELAQLLHDITQRQGKVMAQLQQLKHLQTELAEMERANPDNPDVAQQMATLNQTAQTMLKEWKDKAKTFLPSAEHGAILPAAAGITTDTAQARRTNPARKFI